MQLFTSSISHNTLHKSFREISYISYTRVPNVLCLQGISGEG